MKDEERNKIRQEVIAEIKAKIPPRARIHTVADKKELVYRFAGRNEYRQWTLEVLREIAKSAQTKEEMS
jgi:hypothetical protein